jgi:hypothetical protein
VVGEGGNAGAWKVRLGQEGGVVLRPDWVRSTRQPEANHERRHPAEAHPILTSSRRKSEETLASPEIVLALLVFELVYANVAASKHLKPLRYASQFHRAMTSITPLGAPQCRADPSRQMLAS